MTRLKQEDISTVPENLVRYDSQLRKQTGKGILAIAAYSCGADVQRVEEIISDFTVHIVPITSGLGVISGFSSTVCSILQFLGFQADVSSASDASGIAEAYESAKDGLFIADDMRFVGINLHTRKVADNTLATAYVYSAALDLLAGGIADKEVLVVGCGPVGEYAAGRLLSMGADVYLYDTNISSAKKLAKTLASTKVHVMSELTTACKITNILEATPSACSVPDSLLTATTSVAAPGVPLGLSQGQCDMLRERLIHDKLELGVAAMAVSLLNNKENR